MYIESCDPIKIINFDVKKFIVKDFEFDKINNQIKELSEIRRSIDVTDNKYQDSLFPETKEGNILKSFITEKVSEVSGKQMKCDNIWSLILEKNQSTIYHSHKRPVMKNINDLFSITFYTNVPEKSAELIFVVTAFNTFEYNIQVKPEKGMLLIFNSAIPHMSSLHLDDEQRIVISANFSPK